MKKAWIYEALSLHSCNIKYSLVFSSTETVTADITLKDSLGG